MVDGAWTQAGVHNSHRDQPRDGDPGSGSSCEDEPGWGGARRLEMALKVARFRFAGAEVLYQQVFNTVFVVVGSLGCVCVVLGCGCAVGGAMRSRMKVE